MKTIFVGMDVSKDDFKAAIRDDLNNPVGSVKVYGHDKADLDAFVEHVRGVKRQLGSSAIFGMEATGIYHLSAYKHLVEAGEEVKVFNALELKRFKNRIRKTKTDDRDAQAIAEALLRAREPGYHHASEPELIRLRELCRLRERLVRKGAQCKNQAVRDMDVLCRGYTNVFADVFHPASVAIIKETVRTTKLFEADTEELARILAPHMLKSKVEPKAKALENLFRSAVIPEYMKESCILEIHMLIQQYELIRQQVKRIEKRIETQVRKTNTKLLTVPGIGILTAGIILGELGNLNRFESLDQLTAYAGLDPSVMQSGRSRRTGRISKRGSPMLREAVYNAALSASRANPVCRQFYQRLKEKGKHHKICMVAVARKLLHIAYSVERNNRDFYVPAYIIEQQAATA